MFTDPARPIFTNLTCSYLKNSEWGSSNPASANGPLNTGKKSHGNTTQLKNSFLSAIWLDETKSQLYEIEHKYEYLWNINIIPHLVLDENNANIQSRTHANIPAQNALDITSYMHDTTAK